MTGTVQDAAQVPPFQGEVLWPEYYFKFPSYVSACLSALVAEQTVSICLSDIFPTGSGWDEL